eukprot:294487_1
MCSKAMIGIICGIIAVCLNIAGVWINEITRVDLDVLDAVYWCGWDGAGSCADCEGDPILSTADYSDYSDGAWADSCDASGTDIACDTETAGIVWLAGLIGGIVFGVFGICGLFFRSGRVCAPWLLIIAGAATATALVWFLVVGSDDLGCFDIDNIGYTFAISAYFATGATVLFFVGGVGSCGAATER